MADGHNALYSTHIPWDGEGKALGGDNGGLRGKTAREVCIYM